MEKKNETVKERLRVSDLLPRILCVLVALIIWLYVMMTNSPNYEWSSAVSVLPENVAVLTAQKNLSVISSFGGKVTITAVGQRSSLLSEEISAYVDVSSVQEAGHHQLPVEVRLPSGCTVQSISPATVEVYVDEIRTKTVPVTVDAKLYVSDPLILGVAEPDFETVTVTGPAAAVELSDHATVTLEADREVTGTLTARGDLVVYTASGEAVDNPYITLSERTVGVTVPVYMQKTYTVEAVSKYGHLTAENAIIKTDPKLLTLRGDPKALSAVEDVTAVFDETLLADTNRTTATVELPAEVENVDGSNKVTITVEHKGTLQKELAISNIRLSNPNGLSFTLDSNSVNVKLRAPAELAAELFPEDFELVGELNYSGNVGKVEVPLTLVVPERYGSGVYALGSVSVFVTVGE